MKEPRIAIVHDALVNAGGAERTVTYMSEAFPNAPIYTSVYLQEKTYSEFRNKDIHVLPGARRINTEQKAKLLFPLWIYGFRKLDLKDFDYVLSSSTFAAKYITPPGTIQHTCYCYAPFRLLWKPEAYSQESMPFGIFSKHIFALLRPWLKQVDYHVMQDIPKIATTCENMAREIQKHYNRKAKVIHVPIRLSMYNLSENPGDYYLSVSRLISHKRVDLIINACNQLGKKLIVVGDGPEKASLMDLANDNIQFVGKVPDNKLRELYSECRALIFASHEDYGLAPLETQASGRPVIAYGMGGVLETVIENQCGVFFKEQSVNALVNAINQFEKMEFNPLFIREQMQRFDIENFIKEIREAVISL
jgi:glycosyltransferase involved in cell wall biosynthesis